MCACPSHQVLARLGRDSLDGTEPDGIEAHVQNCPSCLAFLDKRLLHDTTASPGLACVPVRGSLPRIPGFEIEGELGRGAMGVVYGAWEPKLARRVALKIVPSGPLTGPRERTQWLDEARCLTRVRHPNIVAIHDADEADGWLYLLLEFVPGGSLKDRLKGPVTSRAAAELMIPIASALEAVHRAELVHLDLKPSNILLAAGPETPLERAVPRVADFGISRPWGQSNTSAASHAGPLGTPSYMAPEQVTGGRSAIEPAADVYALGAILYELLTGRPPFEAATPVETMHLVRNQDPVRPRILNPAVPRDLETICLTCLQKAPGRRYPSAEAFADDLRRWLDGLPIRARRTPPWGHAWRWCRRRPAVAALVAALAVSLAGGLSGLVVLLDRAEAERARAATARRHAEDYERFSVRTAQELIDLVQLTLRRPSPQSRDHVVVSLLKLGDAAGELKRRGPYSSYTGGLQCEIARGLLTMRRPAEAKPILEATIHDLGGRLRADPDNRRVQVDLSHALFLRSDVAKGEGRFEDAVDLCERSAALHLDRGSDPYTIEALPEIYYRLLYLADFITLSGPPGGPGRPLARCRSILDRMKADSQKNPDDNRIQEYLSLALARGRFSPASDAALARKYEHDPEAWAEVVVAALRERKPVPGHHFLNGLSADMVPSVVLDLAALTASHQRRAGRHDDARRTAERLMVLGRTLVREFPDAADSHLVVSEAHFQAAKDAGHRDDDDGVKRSWTLALDAARRALELDPNSPEASRRIDGLVERLEKSRAATPWDRRTSR